MLRNVVALVLEEVHPFELGVACEVFGLDRTGEGLPGYDFALASHRPGDLRTHAGFTVNVPHGFERLAEADLVIAAATGIRESYPVELVTALRAAVDRGARVLSICTGSFLLGAAGLLDGRRSAAHWRNAAELARRFPLTRVESDVLYVDDDPVITSAGTAAGIDACLHLVRKVQGWRWRAGSPGGWWWPRTARAARRSTSTGRWPMCSAPRSARCSAGCARSWSGTGRSSSSPPART